MNCCIEIIVFGWINSHLLFWRNQTLRPRAIDIGDHCLPFRSKVLWCGVAAVSAYNMAMETVLDHQNKIKELIKEAFAESLDDPKGPFRKLFAEMVEDIAMAKAIEEARDSPEVSREEIFRILEGGA